MAVTIGTLGALLVARMAVLPALAAEAEPLQPPASTEPAAVVDRLPEWQQVHTFQQLGRQGDTLLTGMRNVDQVEFGVRRDRLALEVELDLDFTTSPALLPVLSHLRVYLNSTLMGVVRLEVEDIGQRRRRSLALDPRLIQDFNQVRVEFVGHYTDICEDPAHSSLWLSLNTGSRIRLREQALSGTDDLSWFPLPFFDERETAPIRVPMVFAGVPSLDEQRAAAIMASHFGNLADWRTASFPVLYNRLPPIVDNRPLPSVVFATNDQRPAFMADETVFPDVDGPVIRLIQHPGHRYGKLLLLQGQDASDLVEAATAVVVGGELLRGLRVDVEEVQEIVPRQPYDAPRWVRTDRPVRFAELVDFPGQLQVRGFQPNPITIDLHLPPDLFVWHNNGIPLQTAYRYTPPPVSDESHLAVILNDEFITSYPLRGRVAAGSSLEQLRLNILPGDATAGLAGATLSALSVGGRNTLRYDFNYTAKVGNAQRDTCQTFLPVEVRSAIDEESVIDFSGFHHYIALPDLRAFARSAFPFSRMADLSETLVMMPPAPDELQVGTMLDLLGVMGSRIGYPALGVRISDDWDHVADQDADVLMLGPMPAELRDDPELRVLLDSSRSWLRQDRRPWRAGITSAQRLRDDGQVHAASDVSLFGTAPIAAIVGFRSPEYPQRSIVALMASTADDYRLLRGTLGDVGKMNDFVYGSVALIRESGVASNFVGRSYFVGHLPWWTWLWFHLSPHPVLVAIGVALGLLLLGFILWRLLGALSRTRQGGQSPAAGGGSGGSR